MSSNIRVGIVGANGYTGSELLRLLIQHPAVELSVVTSRAEAGKRLDFIWPHLKGKSDLKFTVPDANVLAEKTDVVFFATPHTVAMSFAPELIERGCKVIDLSADFRIKDIALWEEWYGEKHLAPDLVETAVYGLPEIARDNIKTAQLVACPGCYPTAVQLGLLPLVESDRVDNGTIIANSASGVSGAGRSAKTANLFSELSDNFKAYGVSGHRHLPEIEQGLNSVAKSPVALTFIPHLLPMIRGIHATLYARPHAINDTDWQKLFEDYYSGEPFVQVLPKGIAPETRVVKGTNLCQISVNPIIHSGILCILVVEDNLTKGAAGQAVQAMNIMFGLDETSGLTNIALIP